MRKRCWGLCSRPAAHRWQHKPRGRLEQKLRLQRKSVTKRWEEFGFIQGVLHCWDLLNSGSLRKLSLRVLWWKCWKAVLLKVVCGSTSIAWELARNAFWRPIPSLIQNLGIEPRNLLTSFHVFQMHTEVWEVLCCKLESPGRLLNFFVPRFLQSHFSHVLLFGTLWTVAYQVSLSLGFSRQEYWSGLPCPPPGDLPNPGIEPAVLCIGRWVCYY